MSASVAPVTLAEMKRLRADFAKSASNDNIDSGETSLKLAEYLLSRSDFDEKGISGLLSELKNEAEETFADWAANFVGNVDIEENKQRLKDILRREIYDESGEKRSIEEFIARCENLYTPFLTGHPTTRKNLDHTAALGEHIAHKAGSKSHGPETLDELKKARTKPYKAPTLEDEWAQNLGTMRNVHAARKMVQDVMIDIAQEEYPKDWMKVNYVTGSVGTWMFYDWDGRTDITWQMVAENRFLLQELMLEDYLPRFQMLRAQLEGKDGRAVDGVIKKIEKTLHLVRGHRDFCKNYTPEEQKKDEENGFTKLAEWNNHFAEDAKERITHPKEISDVFSSILKHTKDPVLQKMLVQSISDLAGQGISYAQPHFRINATSVHNVLLEYGIKVNENEDTEETTARNVARLEKRIEKIKPQRSNFIDIARSDQKLVTQLSLQRQFVTKLDSHCPTKLLVAETRSPVAILGAIHEAKRLGVMHDIKVVGLIEDQQGSRQFKKMMECLMDGKAYPDHALTPRPHNPLQEGVEIQLGWSDFGIGDKGVGAPVVVHLHDKNIRDYVFVIADYQKKHPRARHAQAIIIQTGGHKGGRALSPGSIRHSQSYMNPADILLLAEQKGVRLKFQRSFQGPSGQIFIATPSMAFADQVQSLDYFLNGHKEAGNDPYYTSMKKIANAIMKRIRVHNLKISKQAVTKEIRMAWKNLGWQSGSRAAIAQGSKELKIRAIMANKAESNRGYHSQVIGGIAEPILKSPASMRKLVAKSRTFRERLALPVRWAGLSDPGITKSSYKILDPEFWRERARQTKKGDLRSNFLKCARDLQKFGFYERFKPQADREAREYKIITDFFNECVIPSDDYFKKPTIRVSERQRALTQIAHSIIIAAHAKQIEVAGITPDIADSDGRPPQEEIVKGIMMRNPGLIKTVDAIFQSHAKGQKVVVKKDPSDIKHAAGYPTFRTGYIKKLYEYQYIGNEAACAVYDGACGLG